MKTRSYAYDPFVLEEGLRDKIENLIPLICVNDPILRSSLLFEVKIKCDPISPSIFPPLMEEYTNFHTEFISSFFTLAPVFVAKQIALVEQFYFSLIDPHELMGQKWNSRDENTKKIAENLVRCIQHFNSFYNWGVTTILVSKNKEERSKRVNFFGKLLKRSIKINNFNCATWCHAVLNSVQITNLQSEGHLEINFLTNNAIESFSKFYDHNYSL